MPEMPQAATNKPRFTVFLSYSRKDNLSFADQVVKGLETFGGMSVLLDRNSIAGGEVWTARTQHLIESCDTILLAVSPEGVKSEICNWEIDLALATKKRVFTVFNHDMPDADVPERVRTIHRIFFFENPAVPGSGFATGLAELVEMLRTDVGWVRKHSEVAAAAKRWDDNGRRPDDLYKGSQLEEALRWRDARPAANAPELTDLQTAFLNESDARQRFADNVDRRRNQRIAVGLLAVFGVVMMIGLVAFIQAKNNAYNLGILYAELSQQAFDKSDYTGAMRWALAGLDTGGGEAFGPDSDLAEFRLTEADYFNPLLAQRREVPASKIAAIPGGTVAAISDDGEVTILDGETLTKRGYFRFDNPGGDEYLEVFDAQISPDGSGLLIASNNAVHAVRVFDMKTGSLRLALNFPGDVVPCARYSKDGRWILTTHRGGVANLWDAGTGELFRAFDQHYAGAPIAEGNRLNCAVLSPDGTLAATAGDDGFVRLWQTATGKLDQTAPVGTAANGVDFSPDGSYLAVGTNGGAVIVWDLAAKSSAGRLNHGAPVLAVSFSADERTLLTLASDGLARQWSVPALLGQDQSADSVRTRMSSPSVPRMIYSGRRPMIGAAFQPNGGLAFGVDNAGGVYAWDATVWDADRRLQTGVDAVSPDGRLVAVAGAKAIEIRHAASGANVIRIPHGHTGAILQVAFSPSGKTVLTASQDKTVRVFDIAVGRAIGEVPSRTIAAHAASFSADGNSFVAVSRQSATIALVAKAEVRCVIAPGGDVTAAALTSDGAKVAVATVDRARQNAGIDIWDVGACQKLNRLTGVDAKADGELRPDEIVALFMSYADLSSLQFSADDAILFAGFKSFGAEVFDVNYGRKIGRIGQMGLTRRGSHLSVDGHSIVMIGSDGTVEIWDIGTGAPRIALRHDDQVRLAQFVDGQLGLTTVTQDGQTHFYNLAKLFGGQKEERVAASCRRLVALNESAFSDSDSERPVLQSRAPGRFDPCRRKGLLNSEFWMDGFRNAGWKL